jgi:hypothetical protein
MAGVIALLLAVVAVILLRGGGDKTTSPSRGGGAQTTGKGGQEAATLTADNVTFEDFYGVALPKSDAGPAKVTNGRALGFEHSPNGAVLVAIHILYRASASPGPSVFEPTVKDQVVGPDRDTFLSKIQRDYAAAAPSGTGPNGELAGTADQARAIQSKVWAYRVDAYDSSVASVQVLLRSMPGGTGPLYVNLALTVKWIDGDWRLVAPLNGEFASVSRQVSDVPQSYVVIGRA